MDPYHWPKQRPQQSRPAQPQPPSQSSRPQQQQQSLRTSATPSFLSQPLMSTGFPPYAHSTHPPPPAPPPYQPIHHSQNVGDTMVPHPHSYQNVQNPLAVPIQHSLPQLPQLHHHSINSQTQSAQQHPSNQPPLQIQHPPIPHSAHPPHLQPSQPSQQQQQAQPQHPQQQQQPQSQSQHQQQQQQQRQQQSQQHQQPQSQQQQQPPQQQQPHPPSSSQQLPPPQHPQPQSNQPHHQSHHRSHLHPPPHQHQQPRSISIQPPPRQLSPPTLASPQSRAHRSPHSRDVPSANPQVIGQQLSHLNQNPQQLPQHSMQQAPPQQTQQHQQQPSAQPQPQQYRQHPQHHRQQTHEPARVVYDSSSVYRLSQPQQQYFNPYSTAQQHAQSQQLTQHPSMYSSMPIPSHEYQQQPGSVTIPQETTVRSLPSQRMPPIHQHPPQPATQHPRQSQPHIPQQQQTPHHMQSAQRPSQKLVAPLQPQPMQMVQMSRTQGQQHQDGQPLHHVQQQSGDPVSRQPLPSAPLPQGHQLPHSQQPRHITQTQSVPPTSARPQVPERRSSPSHMHPPTPQSQVHMTSAAIPSTMQVQQHQHQMQRQVITGQPMQPRDRQHVMQPLMSQKPKASQISVMQQQGTQPGKIPQATHLVQQSGQSNELGIISHAAGQQFQDATSKHIPQNSSGALRSDVHVTSVAGSERQAVKQELIPEQSGGVRQLKVEDALAYLEQVKSQFSNNPGVYNHFLDIMKEFKANTINTAEVIRRVSALFQGNRKLILGFNTFLPPGYKIELRNDPTTGCVTGFSSPGGVFCPLIECPPEPHPEGRHQSAPYTQHGEIREQPSHISTVPVDPSAQHGPPHGRQAVSQTGDVRSQDQHPGMRPGFDHAGYHQPINVADKDKQMVLVPQSQEGISISRDVKTQPMQQAPKDNAAAALAERFASSDQGVPVPGKRIEFEQAVTYVNKIKSRFADDQQAYQTFLGILQTYQKEQKSIKEVYKQVSHLFRDHDDLLGEFSNFLPEQSPQTHKPPGISSQRVVSDAVSGRSKGHASQIKQQPILDGTVLDSAAPAYSGAKKEKSGKSTGRGRPSKPASVSLAAAGGISKSTISGRQKLSAQEKKGRKSAGTGKKSGHDGKAGSTHGTGHVGQLASSEGATPELEFFDELRSLLGPDGQQNYSEFIKCLSLFSQEIICGDELMRLADGLLSHRKPLTDAFRAFLDQADPRATQTAVEVLRRAKASAEGLDRAGSSSRGPPAPPVASTPAVRERLRDLPPLVGIGSGGASAHAPGSRSPKLNPLYKGKPLSQIGRDFGTELTGTTSYVTLPADVVQIQCSGMTAEDRTVLNHMFVSKRDKAGHTLLDDDPARSGSARDTLEKSSSAPRGQSANAGAQMLSPTSPQGQQSLGTKITKPLSIDDQRLELEMMISRAKTTSEKLEQLMKGEIRNLSTFTAVDFKPIELVYKGASFDVIDVLRTNPNVTAPVVLNRLRQRLTDWHTSRKKIERLWKSSRFTEFSGSKEGPRTWRRSELKEELMCNRAVDHDNESNHRRSSRASIDCDLVCEDENLTVICDILWYAFEWEAEDVETADKGLEFVERLYGVIQKAQRKGIAMYIDEHLYVYVRLLAEVSQRVKYVLEHNYDGLTTRSLVQKVKDVLGGTVSLPAYDEHCRKLYGDSGEWTSFLSDFPLVCKRLAETAMAVPQMRTSNELLHHAEGIVQSEDSTALRDAEVPMKETKTETSPGKISLQESGKGVTQRLRSALNIAGTLRDEIFEVKVLQKSKVSPEASNDPSKNVNETKWVLRIRHVPRETASQFERLTQETDQEQPISSAVTKYIRRAMKRKRQHDLIFGTDVEKASTYQKDGLDVRVKEGSGEKMYVMGTEDFFMKSTFVKRKAARLMLSESRKSKEVTAE